MNLKIRLDIMRFKLKNKNKTSGKFTMNLNLENFDEQTLANKCVHFFSKY